MPWTKERWQEVAQMANREPYVHVRDGDDIRCVRPVGGLINPYAVDEFAEAMLQALTMPEDEQEARMRHLRQQVEDNNIYRGAGMLLSETGKLVSAPVSALAGTT